MARRDRQEPRRSSNAPLWALGIALVGYPLLRDATADKMQRYAYRNQASCECAYSSAQCHREENEWVGPWFARDAADREPGDPGAGRYCGRTGSGFHGGYYAGGAADPGREVGPATGVRSGYRGGFGATGSVRAAGG
jgi:hypothetical protein